MEAGAETGEWRHERKSCLNFITGTVLHRIWLQILLMSSYTTAIVAVHNYVDGFQLNIPVSLMSIIGGVTGLLLVFRTNTAYDRYWEGRKLWSSMTNHCRALTLGIWVGLDGKYRGSKVTPETQSGDMIERLSAINLLLAFVYATKNYLRGEYSYHEKEMKDLISHLIKFRTPSSNKPLHNQSPYNKPKNGKNVNVAGPETSIFLSTTTENGQPSKVKRRSPEAKQRMKAYDLTTETNIPLEVIYHLYSYIQEMAVKGGGEGNVMRNLQGSVLSLVTCLTEFERILRTPMPMAYSLHLFYTVYIYLLSLPFQFVGNLNWITIPIVTLASFCLLGILAIGGEIENPFGYDENDLPLDDFCKVIRREMEMITANPMPEMNSWIMSHNNCPIAPTSWLNAQELARDEKETIVHLLSQRGH